MNNGVLAGMPHAQAEVEYAGVYFNTLQMDSEFPGGESPRHFYNRISQSFRNLCRRVEDQELASNVLLVTHGGVINILYYVLSGQEWSNQSSFYTIDHTSIHTVMKANEGWKMSEMNIRNHLNET